MYVIKGTISTGPELLYPAENCTFNTAETLDNKAYEVTAANFHDNGTTSVITNPVLGIISKTGRFTPITQ
jgi:hypothetical protein